jgi:hypothetical protein
MIRSRIWWGGPLRNISGQHLLKGIICWKRKSHKPYVSRDFVSGGDWRWICFNCERCGLFLGTADVHLDKDDRQVGPINWVQCEECRVYENAIKMVPNLERKPQE